MVPSFLEYTLTARLQPLLFHSRGGLVNTHGRTDYMADKFNPEEDKETRELTEDIVRKLESMTPDQLYAFSEFVKIKRPDLYEFLFIDPDYDESEFKPS